MYTFSLIYSSISFISLVNQFQNSYSISSGLFPHEILIFLCLFITHFLYPFKDVFHKFSCLFYGEFLHENWSNNKSEQITPYLYSINELGIELIAIILVVLIAELQIHPYCTSIQTVSGSRNNAGNWATISCSILETTYFHTYGVQYFHIIQPIRICTTLKGTITFKGNIPLLHIN